MFRSICASAACALLLAQPLSTHAAGVRPFLGSLILARSGAQSLYLWDASKYVAQLVSDKDLGPQGLRDLEATAIKALAAKIRSSRAKSVALSVLYSKTGAVSPVYGTATFAGVEKVLTLSSSRSELVRYAARDADQLLRGANVGAIHVTVTGTLPPAQ